MRRVTGVLVTAILLLPACTGRPSGPSAADYYGRYEDRLREAEVLEKKGDRVGAIGAYTEAKDALEAMRVKFKDSAYYDAGDLAHVKGIINRLRDEERRGVDALVDSRPERVEEPPMSGELYHSIRGGIEHKIGKLTNHETGYEPPGLDRVKRVEPDVVDNTPALVIHITANDRFIEGMMYQEIKRDLLEALKVVHVHDDDLGPYDLILLAGYKAVPGVGGYAEPVLMVEYRFTKEDYKKIDWSQLEGDDADISKFATSTREP